MSVGQVQHNEPIHELSLKGPSSQVWHYLHGKSVVTLLPCVCCFKFMKLFFFPRCKWARLSYVP